MNTYLLGGAMAAAIAIAPAVAQVPAPAPVAPQIQDRMDGTDMRSAIQTRAAVVGHVRTMFDRLDANRDGSITKAEGEAMRDQMHHKMAERKMARATSSTAPFDRLDANRDGSVSRAEFDAAHAKRMARMDTNGDGKPDRRMGARMGRGHGMGGMGGRMFETADANHDGRVTVQEATNAALRHFDTADVNRDGQLTPDERKQMHQRMRADRKPG